MDNFYKHMDSDNNADQSINNQTVSSDNQKVEPMEYSTFLGRLPNPNMYNPISEENINKYIGAAALAPIGPLGEVAGMTMSIPGQAQTLYKYLTPTKDLNEFKESLGPQNAEENVQNIATTIQDLYDSNKADALTHQKNVQDMLGNQEMFSRSPGNSIVSPHPSDYILNFDNPESRSLYTSSLKNKHDLFMKNQNYENSAKLDSELGSEIGYLKARQEKGLLEGNEKDQLSHYIDAQNALRADQDAFFERVAPEAKGENDIFREKYKTNVVPLQSPGVLQAITKGRQTTGITPNEISSEFAFPRGAGRPIPGREISPSQYTQTALNQGGPELSKMILNNKLLQMSPKSAGDLLDALTKLKTQGGYDQYISPEMLETVGKLARRENMGNWTKGAIGGGIGEVLGGHLGAIGGGALGYGLKNIPPLVRAIANAIKKG